MPDILAPAGVVKPFFEVAMALASSALLQLYFRARLGFKTFWSDQKPRTNSAKNCRHIGSPSVATCSLLVLSHFLQPTTVEWRIGDDI